jgi:hypothetical protein
MITERILLAANEGVSHMSAALRADYERAISLPRLWPLAVLLALWHRRVTTFNGYNLDRDLNYVDSLSGRFASLRPFVERAAAASDLPALMRAGSAWAYLVQVMGVGTLQGIVVLPLMKDLLWVAPPPINLDAIMSTAKIIASVSEPSRARQFDAPMFPATPDNRSEEA